MIRPSYIYDESVEKGIIDNINKINYLSKNKEVNFCVPLQCHIIRICSIQSLRQKYLDLFKIRSPHSQLKVNTVADFQNMFSDRSSWNHVGAYQGYVDIISLLFNGKERPDTPNKNH